MFKNSKPFIAIIAAVLAQNCTASTVSLGSSIASAMAGAGLALQGVGAGAYTDNPAMFAYNKGFHFYNIDLGLNLDGVGLSDLSNLGSISNGGLNTNTLINFAKKFGTSNASIGGLGRIGFAIDGFAVGLDSSALVKTVPNAPLQQWAQAGANIASPVAGMQLDGYGYGYYSVNVGYGHLVKTAQGANFALGAQVRFIRTYYTHQYVSENQIISSGGNTSASLGSEMGGQNVIGNTGVGLNVGFHLGAGSDHRFQVAGVINNLIQPNVGVVGTLPNLSSNTTDVNPFLRSFSLGTGYELKKGSVVALDWDNIGTNLAEIRAGASMPFGPARLSVGYGTAGGFTVGVGLYGINFTFGSTDGLRAGTFFRF